MPSDRLRVCPLRGSVDPRLVRFSAGATALTLAVVLLIVDVARPLALGLLASQVAVFAFTAFVSFQWSVWAQIFARFIWPRIEAPTALEDARPPRFAQFLGFVFTALGFTFFAVDIDGPGYGLTGLAFGASTLNAATGWCLGCKAYLLSVDRSRPERGRPPTERNGSARIGSGAWRTCMTLYRCRGRTHRVLRRGAGGPTRRDRLAQAYGLADRAPRDPEHRRHPVRDSRAARRASPRWR